MNRRALVPVALLSLVVLAGGVWWFGTPHGPRVVEEGTPLPLDQPVEMRFHDEKSGETETWKLEKKTTTREEALGRQKLPEPDPAGKDHEPNESARALDGLALEAWKQSDLQQALHALRAGRRGGSGRSRAALPLRAAPDARHRLRARPARSSSGPRRSPRRIRRSGSTSSPSTSAPSSSS